MNRILIIEDDTDINNMMAEALQKAGRQDLIGYGPKCLIRPRKEERSRAGGGRKTAERTGQTGKNGQMAGKSRQPETRRKKTIRNVHQKKTGGK